MLCRDKCVTLKVEDGGHPCKQEMVTIEKEAAATKLRVSPFEVASDKGRCGSIVITCTRNTLRKVRV
jgi:hypothetical protein